MDTDTTTITATVDAKGQSCPGPLVSLAKAMRDARSGERLELLEASESDGVYRYLVRKS